MTKPRGRTIKSEILLDEFRAKELNRRNFIQRVAAASAGSALLGGLPGCSSVRRGGDDDDSASDDDDSASDDDDSDSDDDDAPAPVSHLVGVGGGDGYKAALSAAMDETIARDGLAGVVNKGDTVFLKVNSNSGDYYPYSTRPRMIEELCAWCWDQGAGQIIVGDRSFWGDPNTYSNLVANGVVEATENSGAELLVLDEDDGDLEWMEFAQSEAADWNGGFRYPVPVLQADVIINLPIVKTHFISTFTMSLKNMIGLVHSDDRRRTGNLDTHVTAGNKLYRQIAQLNEHMTPTLNILDGWEAVIRGGPTQSGNPSGLVGEPGVMIVSTDRVAADIMGLAVLKTYAVGTEDIHNWDVWENPQIVEAIASNVGVSSPDDYDAAGPTAAEFEDYMDLIV